MSHFRRHSELQSSLNVNQKIYFQITWRSVRRFETSKRPLPPRTEWAGWDLLCNMYLLWLHYLFVFIGHRTLETKYRWYNLAKIWIAQRKDSALIESVVNGVGLSFNSFLLQHQFWVHYSWLLLSDSSWTMSSKVFPKSPVRVHTSANTRRHVFICFCFF